MERLVAFIISELSREASFLLGYRRTLRDIEGELARILDFLRDMHMVKDSKDGLKIFVTQVRDLAYEIQDRLDQCMYKERINHHPFMSFPFNRQILQQFEKIKSQVDYIFERGTFYGFAEGSSSVANEASENWLHHCGNFAHLKPDDDIVGIEDKKKEMIGWLRDEGNPQRSVLSVVGMPGVGKTTFVREVYKDVKIFFSCHAWITVSQSYKIDHLLRSMFEEFYKSRGIPAPHLIREMDYTYLVSSLKRYLEQLSYVIVLDDLWNEDALKEISAALPNNQLGSRVILTTRMEHVTLSLGSESTIFRHERLSDDDAWKLFCKKTFLNNANRCCPVELEPYARRIVHKCEGLPMYIVAISRLMLLKGKNAREWRRIEDSFSWVLSNNPTLEKIKNLQLLSYNDLPYHLKYCFLYCSLFPENYIISPKKLIRLWIAEGFVESNGEHTLEEEGKHYLDELVHRNMLEVAHIDNFQLSKGFRLPQLLRKLALSIGKEENFCMVYNDAEANVDRNGRHLSIQNGVEDMDLGRKTLSRLRALFLFTAEMTQSRLTTMMCKFKFLRVLSLEIPSIENVPDQIPRLFNLRYLSLKNTRVSKLPGSVGKLLNLETLDLRKTYIKKLPEGVKQMKNLRHVLVSRLQRLNGFDHLDGFTAPKGICKLEHLQTLTMVDADDDLVRKVGNLDKLRKFEIVKVRRQHGLQLCSSIQNMKFLLFLHVMADKDATLDLESSSSPSPFLQLQKLVLSCRLVKLPDWVDHLANLTLLSLHGTQMTEDPVSSLEALPKLENLKLWEAYEWQSLYFRAEKFTALKTLELCQLALLKEIKIEEGSLPCLQKLNLTYCLELKVLPEGIEYLSKLNELILDSMPLELQERIQGDDIPKKIKVTKKEAFMRCYTWRIGRQITLSTPAESVSNTQVEIPLQGSGRGSPPGRHSTPSELVSDPEVQESPRGLPLSKQTSHIEPVSYMEVQIPMPPRDNGHDLPLSTQIAAIEQDSDMEVHIAPTEAGFDLEAQVPLRCNGHGLPLSRQVLTPPEPISDMEVQIPTSASPLNRKTTTANLVSDMKVEELPRDNGPCSPKNRWAASLEIVSNRKMELPPRGNGHGSPPSRMTAPMEAVPSMKLEVLPKGSLLRGQLVSNMKEEMRPRNSFKTLHTFECGESSARRPTMPKWFIPPPLWTMQKGHLSNYRFNGQSLPKYRSKHAWRKVVNWYCDLSPIHKDLIGRTPFASFFQSKDFHDNLELVTALIERWRGETNTFHLPIGEVTITPLDFHLLSGLRMSGKPVVFCNIPDDKRILGLLGQVPSLEARQGKSIKRSWIIQNFRGRGASNTTKVEVLQDVRAFLWYTLSGTFFAFESGNAPLSLLELLAKLPYNTYDWGGAAYAFMLRGLRMVSLSSATSIIGFPPIIEAWFYEYFPTYAPTLVSKEEWFPRLGRWNAANRLSMPFTTDSDVALSQVDKFDLLKFKSQPFVNCSALQCEAGQEALGLSRLHTIFRFGKRLEWYLGSRVYRQWGDQVPGPNILWPIPRDVPVPMPLNTISDLDYAHVREMRINADDDMLMAYLPHYQEWYKNNSLPQLLSISFRTQHLQVGGKEAKRIHAK